ncbi:MAG: ABC transporter permease [Desulfatiglans sp.]|jgi:osmoprotectant transport system permease protein|nr:ABC transporter permease [Thermodesulfobacteriota bacterium]MEE4354704.1 ABC transporter permease [Desulfatiglans sp.]
MSKACEKAYRLALLVVLLAAGVLLERAGLIEYLSDPFEIDYTLRLMGQHIRMVVVSMVMATALGLMLGIIFSRPKFKRYTGVIMYVVGLGQTIPSLAVIALAMSFLGIGFKAAIFALFIYSVLPIARNTLAGITAVPPWVIDAAKGMGMSASRILFQVEIPHSMSVILAGFRVSLVINIGTAALAFLIGAGGLGEHIFIGIDLMRYDKLLAGAIPTTLLALLADYLCELLGFLIIPKGLRLQQET